MKQTVLLFSGAVVGTFLAGCHTGQPTTPATGQGPSAKTVQFNSSSSGSGQSQYLNGGDPVGDLTLQQVMDLTLSRSPELDAYRWDIRRSHALERQAALWNNPQLEAEMEEISEETDGRDVESTETTIAISQTIPLGRDIAHRRKLAAARTGMVNWEFESARLEVLMKATRRFIEALAAESRVELAARELELARKTREVAKARVEAGDASPVELMRVEVPVVDAELTLKREKRLREATRRRLALSWDSREPSFTGIIGNLEAIPVPPDPAQLAGAINKNPEMARWTSAISEQMALRRLARAEAIPDPTLRLGLKNRDDPDETALVVGISLPFPIFDRGQGDILAAREGEQAARKRKRAAELRIEAMLSTAWSELANAHEEALAIRDRALPAAEQAFTATQQSFGEGKLSFLDVLDAQRTLFEMESRYLEALVTCHLMGAEIEFLIGQPLNQLTPQ